MRKTAVAIWLSSLVLAGLASAIAGQLWPGDVGTYVAVLAGLTCGGRRDAARRVHMGAVTTAPVSEHPPPL